MAVLSDPSFWSMDDAQRWVLAQLLEHGDRVSPRGYPTLEIAPLSFRLRSPRARHTSIPERRWSLPLAIGEFCWHLSASDDAASLSYYAKRWLEFAENGNRIRGSCYGKRAFESSGDGASNWDRLVHLLMTDPSTRRAVLHFSNVDNAFDPGTLDVACASNLQFLVRNGVLDALLYMRSNDAVWGLPYDVFLFTMLQELLACQLGLEVGTYHHIAGSMHLYERHLGLAERIIRSDRATHEEMPKMAATHQLTKFLRAEKVIRQSEGGHWKNDNLHPYWTDLLDVLDWFHINRSDKLSVNPSGCRLANSLYEELLKHAPLRSVTAL